MTTINDRTPEEIKLRLACIFAQDGGWCEDQESCEKCEYNVSAIYTEEEAARDSLILIQQLARERDAAVEDMPELMQLAQFCRHCKQLTEDGECTFDFAANKGEPWCWQWRGVQDRKDIT